MIDENYWDKAIDSLIENVAEALDTGKATRMTLGGQHDITIDIYVSKSQMKIFDQMILDQAKQKLGIDLVKK